MSYPKVCAQKFALFLYDNNHLEDFKIQKNVARDIYHTGFKNEAKSKVKWGQTFLFGLPLLVRQKNLSCMVYNKNKLLKLKQEQSKIDLQFKKKSAGTKKTLISHSFSFSGSKKSEESVVSLQGCKLCDVQFRNERSYEEHLNEGKHVFHEKFIKAVKQTKNQAELQFAIADATLDNIILRKEVPKILQLTVKNSSKHPVKILEVQGKRVEGVEFAPACPQELAPSISIQLTLTVRCVSEGVLHYPILFIAEINNSVQQYATELVFHTHSEFFDDLHPVEPYKRQSKAVFKEFIEHVDSGERPNIFPQPPNKVPLKPYLLPIDVSVVLNAGLKEFDGISSSQRIQLANIKNLLNVENKKNSLQPSNYAKLLDTLLYIEEHQMHKDIRDYDREDQILKRVGANLLELEVPGLAEHRPSVIFADSVFVREHKQSKTLYEGFVHKVKASSVLLKFSKNFINTVFIPGKKFYVNFTFNRYPLKVEHQAVEFAKIDNIAPLLFPKKISKAPPEGSDIKWFNRDIVNNPQQQQAVRSILKRSAMPAPYLIFGPPGTGKTMTVVESVQQIHQLTNHRILICTPSNNAANEVTRRLVGLPTTDMFRYIAPSFPYDQIPQEIKKYINYPNGVFYQPTTDDFKKYRIIITTLTSAAKLVNSGCPKGHFGYVFIDESGQATETETLIAIARILSHQGNISGQIVLAGDPRQLGPVIHSTLALDYGFAISMLERLMDTSEPYKKDNSGQYNPNALTKLLKNYRSHQAIMAPSNQLFYEDELQTAGDHWINAALNWEHLPNPKFPLIFHNMVGIDQREKNSPSFFNIQEIQVAMNYLEQLIGSKMLGVILREEHVGIISPYKKQVEKLRLSCKNKGYKDKFLIGTVEQVQGQERLIIIISTVRSKSDFVKVDHKFHLGFLNNPKRFNVAISRAKALLIVVGNANLLQFDDQWRHLIKYCKDNGAMKGTPFDFATSEDVEEMVNGVQNIALIENGNPEEGPSFARGNI